MRIIVIPGHYLIGSGAPDPGGCGEAGCEADWTTDLCDAMTVALRRRGHEAAGAELGTAAERSRDADAMGAELVLYVHGDVGRGGVFHFPGSSQGLRWATRLAAVVPPELGTRRIISATHSGYQRANWLLAQTRAPAVLLELVDQRDPKATTWLRAHLAEVGEALASAV